MSTPVTVAENGKSKKLALRLTLLIAALLGLGFLGFKYFSSSAEEATADSKTVPAAKADTAKPAPPPPSNEEYDRLITHITNGDSTGKWPVKVHKESPGLHKALRPCQNPKADVFLNPGLVLK